MSIKIYNAANAQVLAADPSGARAGDHYISSATAGLRYTADGTSWFEAGANQQRSDRLQGYFGSNGDLAGVTGAQQPTSGQVLVTRVLCTKSGTCTGAVVGTGASGASLTAAQNLVGLYSIDGATKLGTSADQATAWAAAAGAKAAAWASSFAVTAGLEYWCAILSVGTTPPTFERFSNHALSNHNVSGAALRWALAASGATALPATLTPSGFSASTLSFAAALY